MSSSGINPERHQAFLFDLEKAVLAVDRTFGLQGDRPVMRAFEVLTHHYRGRRQAGPPLDSTETRLVDGLMRVCELWREQRQIDETQIVACMRRLAKSAQRWHERGGARGYLDYIRQFIPLE